MVYNSTHCGVIDQSVETEKLIFWIRNGNTQAFDVLFNRYYFKVIGFVRRYVDEPEVEDVTQEIFIHVFQKLDQIKQLDYFERYLFKSAKNRCINWLKKKYRIREVANLMWYAVSNWNDQTTKHQFNQLTSIKNIIEELPEEDRKYIELFYIEKHTRVEITKITNESESTVYRRLAAAKAALLDLAEKNNITITFEGRHDIRIEK